MIKKVEELSWKALIHNFNWKYLEHHYFNPFLLRDYEKYDEDDDEDEEDEEDFNDVMSISGNDEYYQRNNNTENEKYADVDIDGEKSKLLNNEDEN